MIYSVRYFVGLWFSNINAGFEAAVDATRQDSYMDRLILKDWYKEQGPNRVSCVVGYGGM